MNFISQLNLAFSIKSSTKCPKEHELLWSSDTGNTAQRGGKFYCNLCQNTFNCANKRWWCKVCNYNVCKLCRPYHQLPVPGECENKHQLNWVNTPYKSDSSCNSCGLCLPCRSGRWNCSTCKYDLCPLCTKALKCCNGHILTWYNDKPKMTTIIGAQYTCKSCEKTFQFQEGLWHCDFCDYHICGDCSGKNSKIDQKNWLEYRTFKDELIEMQNFDEKMKGKTEEDWKLVCKFCLNNLVTCFLLPCGHTLCEKCAVHLKKCPFDRQTIDSKNRLIYS